MTGDLKRDFHVGDIAGIHFFSKAYTSIWLRRLDKTFVCHTHMCQGLNIGGTIVLRMESTTGVYQVFRPKISEPYTDSREIVGTVVHTRHMQGSFYWVWLDTMVAHRDEPINLGVGHDYDKDIDIFPPEALGKKISVRFGKDGFSYSWTLHNG